MMLFGHLILVFLFASTVYGENPSALKITDIKHLVETRNERVSGKNYQVAAMDYRQGYLKRSFMPSLRVGASQERFTLGSSYTRTQPSYGAEVSVNLFNGMKDHLYDKVIDKRKERIGSEKRVTVYQEVIKAKEIYWNLVYLENAKELLTEIQGLNTKNLKSAERRISAGVTTSADRYEFEIKDVEIKRGLDHIEMQKKILARELTILLGFDEGTPLVLSDKLVHFENMEAIGEHTEKQHQFLAQPSLVQAEENEIEAKIQARSWWPRIDAYYAQNQYNVRVGNIFDAQEGKETVVGVRLTMNLFDFTSGNREASALKAEAEGSKSEAKYLVKQVENEAHSEIASLEYLHRQIHDAEENIKRAQNYLRVTLGEYSRGVKNSPDVLGSIDKLYDVKSRYFEILRDFYITRDHLRSKSEI